MDEDVCRCGSLMHRDGECDAIERVIEAARKLHAEWRYERPEEMEAHLALTDAFVALDATRAKNEAMSEPTFSANGYPMEATEKTIAAWSFGEYRALMEYIKQAWRYPDCWREFDDHDEDGILVRRYEISTAGWSGNESLISAMQDNFIFWGTCWISARRGGHYVFQCSRGR